MIVLFLHHLKACCFQRDWKCGKAKTPMRQMLIQASHGSQACPPPQSRDNATPQSPLLRVHPDGAQRDGLQTGGGETERASRGPHAAQPPQSCPVLPAAEPEWGAGHGPASSSVLPQPGDLEIWQVNWKISIWSKCDSRPPSRESWTAPQTFPQGFQWTLNESEILIKLLIFTGKKNL